MFWALGLVILGSVVLGLVGWVWGRSVWDRRPVRARFGLSTDRSVRTGQFGQFGWAQFLFWAQSVVLGSVVLGSLGSVVVLGSVVLGSVGQSVYRSVLDRRAKRFGVVVLGWARSGVSWGRLGSASLGLGLVVLGRFGLGQFGTGSRFGLSTDLLGTDLVGR